MFAYASNTLMQNTIYHKQFTWCKGSWICSNAKLVIVRTITHHLNSVYVI